MGKILDGPGSIIGGVVLAYRFRFALALLVFVPSALVLWLAWENRPLAARANPGVVWGGRVFYERPDLKLWLNQRGAKYPVWAGAHPRAARRLHPG